jgi:hypothetical protein
MADSDVPEALQLVETQSGFRYALRGKPLYGGDTIALCFSGGWVIGRFEWNSDLDRPPRFHCSIEIEGGRVAAFSLDIPEGALVLRKKSV